MPTEPPWLDAREDRAWRAYLHAHHQLSQDGTITKFTIIWDGSLLDDRAITALAADAVDR